MSFGGGFFGGGESTSTTNQQTTTNTRTADQRIGVEGGLGSGQLVGPEAAVANGAASVAGKVGDFSTLTQTITGNKYRVGMSGADVAAIMQQANGAFATAAASNSDTVDKLSNLATTALGSVQQAQTGVPADWQKYIVPVGVLVVIALAFKRRKAA
jgi:hypothetical protein